MATGNDSVNMKLIDAISKAIDGWNGFKIVDIYGKVEKGHKATPNVEFIIGNDNLMTPGYRAPLVFQPAWDGKSKTVRLVAAPSLYNGSPQDYEDLLVKVRDIFRNDLDLELQVPPSVLSNAPNGTKLPKLMKALDLTKRPDQNIWRVQRAGDSPFSVVDQYPSTFKKLIPPANLPLPSALKTSQPASFDVNNFANKIYEKFPKNNLIEAVDIYRDLQDQNKINAIFRKPGTTGEFKVQFAQDRFKPYSISVAKLPPGLTDSTEYGYLLNGLRQAGNDLQLGLSIHRDALKGLGSHISGIKILEKARFVLDEDSNGFMYPDQRLQTGAIRRANLQPMRPIGKAAPLNARQGIMWERKFSPADIPDGPHRPADLADMDPKKFGHMRNAWLDEFYVNPTKDEVLSLISKSRNGSLRGIEYDGNLYLWDGPQSNHSNFIDVILGENSQVTKKYNALNKIRLDPFGAHGEFNLVEFDRPGTGTKPRVNWINPLEEAAQELIDGRGYTDEYGFNGKTNPVARKAFELDRARLLDMDVPVEHKGVKRSKVSADFAYAMGGRKLSEEVWNKHSKDIQDNRRYLAKAMRVGNDNMYANAPEPHQYESVKARYFGGAGIRVAPREGFKNIAESKPMIRDYKDMKVEVKKIKGKWTAAVYKDGKYDPVASMQSKGGSEADLRYAKEWTNTLRFDEAIKDFPEDVQDRMRERHKFTYMRGGEPEPMENLRARATRYAQEIETEQAQGMADRDRRLRQGALTDEVRNRELAPHGKGSKPWGLAKRTPRSLMANLSSHSKRARTAPNWRPYVAGALPPPGIRGDNQQGNPTTGRGWDFYDRQELLGDPYEGTNTRRVNPDAPMRDLIDSEGRENVRVRQPGEADYDFIDQNDPRVKGFYDERLGPGPQRRGGRYATPSSGETLVTPTDWVEPRALPEGQSTIMGGAAGSTTHRRVVDARTGQVRWEPRVSAASAGKPKRMSGAAAAMGGQWNPTSKMGKLLRGATRGKLGFITSILGGVGIDMAMDAAFNGRTRQVAEETGEYYSTSSVREQLAERLRKRTQQNLLSAQMERLQADVAYNINSLRVNAPEAYQQLVAGRRLPNNAVVFGGGARTDLLERAALQMANGGYAMPQSARMQLEGSLEALMNMDQANIKARIRE